MSYSRARGTPLIAVVIPSLDDLEGSQYGAGKVAAFFAAKNIPTLEVIQLAKNLSFPDRVASRFDMHASVKLNRLIAEKLQPLVLSAAASSARKPAGR